MGKECFFPNFWMDIFVPTVQDKSWCDASIVNRDKYLESSLSWDTPIPASIFMYLERRAGNPDIAAIL